jgi:hypothetical protein
MELTRGKRNWRRLGYHLPAVASPYGLFGAARKAGASDAEIKQALSDACRPPSCCQGRSSPTAFASSLIRMKWC